MVSVRRTYLLFSSNSFSFITEKLAEAQRKLSALKTELKSHAAARGPPSIPEEKLRHRMLWFNELRDKEITGSKRLYRRSHDLKLAFSEYYLSLVLLQNYQNLNSTGFRKITKKHDKVRSKAWNFDAPGL